MPADGAATGQCVLAGCAGWSLPKAEQGRFPGEESHLARYAARLPAVEINSSFYRPHRAATYARWRASVPASFLFSVKIPREISHRLRLAGTEAALDAFLAGASGLGDKLGCLLLQMPPSLAFEPRTVESFLRALRDRHTGEVAAEPRHASWFAPRAGSMLAAFRVGRVAADPPRADGDGVPGGSMDVIYYRLHGSPKIYYSSYATGYLRQLAARLRNHAAAAGRAWCIFDNTALGAALPNALDLLQQAR
jgi:uncharacterized protein YecE (DUF72 family)